MGTRVENILTYPSKEAAFRHTVGPSVQLNGRDLSNKHKILA